MADEGFKAFWELLIFHICFPLYWNTKGLGTVKTDDTPVVALDTDN